LTNFLEIRGKMDSKQIKVEKRIVSWYVKTLYSFPLEKLPCPNSSLLRAGNTSSKGSRSPKGTK
jgi:hypothetical protein